MSTASGNWPHESVPVVPAKADRTMTTEVCTDSKDMAKAKARFNWRALLSEAIEKTKRWMNIALLSSAILVPNSSCTNQPHTDPVADTQGRSEPTVLPVAANAQSTWSDELLLAEDRGGIPVVATGNAWDEELLPEQLRPGIPVEPKAPVKELPAEVIAQWKAQGDVPVDQSPEQSDNLGLPAGVVEDWKKQGDTPVNQPIVVASAAPAFVPVNMSAPEIKDGEIVPPARMVALVERLPGYNDPETIQAVRTVANHMNHAEQALALPGLPATISGAMISKSSQDERKIFADLTDKPEESLKALSGYSEFTRDNYSQIFQAIFPTGNKAERYTDRMTQLQPEIVDVLLKTLNALIWNMPQNRTLLQQSVITVTSLYTYLDPKFTYQDPDGKYVNLSPLMETDQVWRFVLLTNMRNSPDYVKKDIQVLRLMYGNNKDSQFNPSYRFPDDRTIDEAFKTLQIPMPAGLKGIARQAVAEMKGEVDDYVKFAIIDKENQEKAQHTAQVEEAIVFKDKAIAVYEKLNSLIDNPNEALIQEIARELKSVKSEWEAFSPEKRKSPRYAQMERFIGNLEMMYVRSKGKAHSA